MINNIYSYKIKFNVIAHYGGYMALLSGFIIGTAFGFVLKKSRICYMGTIRDIYLEGRNRNILLLFATIFTEAILYNLFVISGIVTDGYMPCFSLIAVPIGSMMFGFGAVMASGCLTMSLVKTGDGRITGIISLVTCVLVGYFFSAGKGRFFAGRLIQTYEIFDKSLIADAYVRLALSALVAIPVYIALWRYNKKSGRKFNRNKSKWFIAAGIVLGITFPVSEHFGRIGGFAITSPILSYPYAILKPKQIVGG